VEHRPAGEVTCINGKPAAPGGTSAYNPAFDVTPPGLITALVTECGVAQPVTAGTLRVLGAGSTACENPPADVYVER
jgi:methylthioribose-1-phosphate isomerase